MAAAEYYNQGSLPPHQQPTRPGQPPAPPTIQQPPYPMFDGPPPPYSPIAGNRPHSQPPPQHRVRFDTSTPQPAQSSRPNQLHPQQRIYDTHQYPPEKLPIPQQQHQQQPPLQSAMRPAPNNAAPQNMYRPSDFNPSHGPSQQPYPQHQQQQPPNGYYPPPPPGSVPVVPPAMSQVYGTPQQQQQLYQQQQPQQRPPGRRYSSNDPAPYDNKPPRSRSRSRSRSRHRHHHHSTNNNYNSSSVDDYNRPHAQRKKSSGVNTFLGAGGGAIIGDLIFPGLGTLGGAILGGVGGHEYGRQRAGYGTAAAGASSGRTRGAPRSMTGTGGRTRSYSDERDYYGYEDDHRRGRR